MWDNTLLFMTSDNGGLPYTGGTGWSDWANNWPLRSGKVTNYEGGIKVWAGMSGGLLPKALRGTTFDGLTHITDFAATAMRLAMTKNEFEERGTVSGSDKIVDGRNLFSLDAHDLIVHNVLPHYYPTWLPHEKNDYAATDGEWKYYMGFFEDAPWGAGWYNVPEKGMVTVDNNPSVFNDAGGYCTSGCLFHLVTDPNEYYDVSDDYPEVTTYFSDLINAIYEGGFDEDYHTGQPYEEDYRGYQADNILRPYLDENAVSDYIHRTGSTTSSLTYDYDTYDLSWDGDYDGIHSPFEG